KSGRRVSLEPMNPFERRVIHTAVQDVPGAESWSVGSENARHVVIGPAGSSHAAGAEDDGAQMEYFGGHGGRGHGYGGGHGGQGGGHRGRRGGRGHGDPGRGQGGGDREFRGNDTSGTSIAGGEFRGSGADVFAGDVFANVPWQVQGERSQNDRVVNNRVMDERGAGERPQRTERGARPQAMRPQGNRPQGNREHSEHPQRAERPAGDRVAGDRIAERPQRTYDANGVPQREPRVVREFVSRSAPRAFAEDEVPGKTESEKEATTALYGRIDL
ncbi:MAG: hypothetical protein FWF49_04115, partial [Oscillospiraceae bacterium]|nr:hypothetical protein [Oscillospiraceae bacterium]